MGILLACETEIQVEVAEQLLTLFPGMEMVRYACSGTETTWHALRVARAHTGRWGVVKGGREVLDAEARAEAQKLLATHQPEPLDPALSQELARIIASVEGA